MNPSAILILGYLREASSDFSRGYAAGMLNGMRFSLEPWEVCYLDHIKSQILLGGRA